MYLWEWHYLKWLSYEDFYENYERFNTDSWFTLLVLLFVLEMFSHPPDPKSVKQFP